METTIDPVASDGAPLVVFSPTMAEIAKWKEQYGALSADTPEGYEEVRLAIREVVSARTDIDRRRLAETAKYREATKQVNALGNKLVDAILDIEMPLKKKKAAVDDAREAAARAIVEAEKARVAALEKAAKDAEEARLKALRDAEEAKLAEERRQLALERARMEEERRKAKEIMDEQEAERQRQRKLIAAEQEKIAKAQREAQAKIDAERRRLDEEKAAAERAKFEREAKQQAERDAVARAEELNRQAKPDLEKIRAFALVLAGIDAPECKHKAAQDFLLGVMLEIKKQAERCKSYKFGGGK